MYVLKVATGKLILECHGRDFNVCNDWLQNVHALRDQKKKREGGGGVDFDEKFIPGMRQKLKNISFG